MLTKDQEKMITMLIEGYRITDIAKKIGVSRTSIYTWKDSDEVKAELNRRTQDIKNQGNAYILKDVNTYIDEVKKIAKESTDQRVKFSANKYLIDRTLGVPTAIDDDETDETNKTVNENELAQELEKFRNMKVIK
ncbi:helix-turn-helix domain-containing protein [Clostridium ljungdahlii]|uniref:Helix-turn-helix domain of resolvase n=1 Tax=Clostridium ljungdahlii (strain ATCC 55383 / DSM 13528 / PETC) TaxID=748727 RepID=D8GT90_CLOLD|nr:helix-turn-helix domain-containing protein [Clostridium ljungdahlii]ADK16689.1 phage-related protein [Clostridium ljungdahlii DSM 13528]OAA89439.1 Helix-turn-helix domain of resolvase [Clostridium ljungdahlii DSM 13528]